MSSPRSGLLLSCALVLALAAPLLTFDRSRLSGPPLHGYTDSVPQTPARAWSSMVDRSFQRWVERSFEVKLGLRNWGVRMFNELNWAVFREAPRLRLISTPADGLYSTMSLDSLNWELTVNSAVGFLERWEANWSCQQ
ncbi:MAG: hypothetical protein EOO38_14175 [Cytophagaceae bacterium]|nr:MAG: hypothetical protein EOO38_14175 [Cytophagaceae bacterium]